MLKEATKRQYDAVIKQIKEHAKRYSSSLSKWKEDIAKHDKAAELLMDMDSDGPIKAVAYLYIYNLALSGLLENDNQPERTWDVRLPHVFRYAFYHLVTKATCLLPNSSSTASSMLSYYSLEAWAKVLEIINDECGYIPRS